MAIYERGLLLVYLLACAKAKNDKQTVCYTCDGKKTFFDIPVVDAPVEAEVEGAEVATFPHHLHHRLIVEFGDVPKVQDSQVPQLREATHTRLEGFNKVKFTQRGSCAA